MNIKIVQRKDRIYADGRCPLFFRFTQKRQCKYISTGIALAQEYWNESDQRIISSYPDSESLNWQLKEKVSEYQKKIEKLTVLEIDVNFETLLGQKSKYINCTISEYFQQQIEYLKGIGKVGTASKYETCKSLLEQCNLGKKRFEQVDLQFLQDFEAYMTRIYNRVHKVIGHVNSNLKRIAEMAGLKVNLTTYVARHTFATVLKRSGVNIAIISESLGHSDLETTQIYLDSFDNSQIDEAMKNLL